MNAAALPFVLPLLVGAALAGYLALAIWRRRSVPGAGPYSALMLLVALWSASEALEMLTPAFADKVLVDRLQYLVVESTPVIWMLLGASLSGRARWFVRWGWLPATALGAFVAATVISGDPNGLVWSRTWLDESSSAPMLRVEHGWLFYVGTAVVYALFAGGGALIAGQASASAGRRGSAGLTVLGVALGLVGGLINAAGITPFGIADATVYGVTFGGIAIVVGHLRYNLLDAVFGVLPVAHEMVVAGLEDGVLVVGAGRCVLYANPSARRILAFGDDYFDGAHLDPRTAEMLGLADVADGAGSVRRDVVLPGEAEPSYYDLRITPLVRSHVPIGLLLVLHDITERKRRESHLEHLAAHDPLTGVANRRTLEVALESALRSAALGEPSVLMYMDVDGFKSVNDTLGHAAGDRVLASLAQSIGRQLRAGDLLARVGGDEFAALLTGLDTSRAFPVAERIRQEVGSNPFVSGSHRFHVTLSVGLAGLGGMPDPGAVLRAADAAMYTAKGRGRDRVVVAEDEPTVVPA